MYSKLLILVCCAMAFGGSPDSKEWKETLSKEPEQVQALMMKGPERPAERTNHEDVNAVPFTTIYTNPQMQLYKKRSFVIFTNQQQVTDFIKANQLPANSIPAIAPQQMYIGVFAGEQGDTGKGLEVHRIVWKENKWLVGLRKIQHQPGSVYLQVLSYPFQLIAIDVSKQMPPEEIEFIDENV